MRNEITSKKYWQQTGVLNNQGHSIPLPITKLLTKVLNKNNDKKATALEIGCAPGTFLSYICKEFNYKPEGIDYVAGSSEITKKTLVESGLSNFIIHEEDFFTWKPNKKYELVSSFGFIEHFHNVNVVINKHISLLKDKGILILEVPNFTHCQYFLHKILDKENLDRHNIEPMYIEFFEKLTESHDFNIKYLGYTGGFFDFWWENNNPTLLQKMIRFFLKPIAFLGRRIPISNKYLSPFLVFIAEK